MAISRFSDSRVTAGLPKYQKMWDQDTPLGALFPIASLNGNANFTSIPQIYQDLLIIGNMRGVNANTIEYLNLQFNGSSANYQYTTLTSDGASASSSRTSPYGGAFWFGNMPGGNSSTNLYGTFAIHIPAYANTSTYKIALCQSAHDQNGSGMTSLIAGTWGSTAAITSVNVFGSNGANNIGQVGLYGIKVTG